MTGEVITLPVGKNRLWVCGCGCATFELRGDGAALCAACGTETAQGGWAPVKDRPVWGGGGIDRVTRGNDDPAFARRYVGNAVHYEDTMFVAVVGSDGTALTWRDDSNDDLSNTLADRLIETIAAFCGERDV